ncbi:MAG: CBS domain-containing protein [Parasporobacterium sp.]|nr:CBS domain-containing protein [Parasporobacterium sp.]
MNILGCLTPKSEVNYITDDASLFKAIQTLQDSNYSSIPIINKKGKYIGTISAGDILGCVKENFNLSVKDSADFPVRNVKRIRDNKPVNGNATMEGIVEFILEQNFVPVVDDEENFIGIITRKEVMKWMHSQFLKEHPEISN